MIKHMLTQKEMEKLPESFYKQAVAIFHLNEVGIEVKQTRVAEWLDVSRANVSQITGRMQNSGLIKFEDNLQLTDKGLYLAKTVARRHRIVERFLSEVLKLPWEKVYAETSKWENILTPVTEKAMLSILGNPTTGLFGNPIPYSQYKKLETRNLLNVEKDRNYSINKITEELKRDASMISFLQENKIVPGSKIIIADANEFSITVSTDNKKFFGLDQYIAERVFVN